MTYFISIDHDESPNLEAYAGVVVTRRMDDGRAQEIKRFMTSDPVQDWKDMLDYVNYDNFEGRGMHIMISSSVDHFAMDVPGFTWTIENDVEVLVFSEEQKHKDLFWLKNKQEIWR